MNVENLLTDMNVEYFQTGGRYMTCCPFHNDTNPSCGIWIDSGYFKCFACGEEGSFAEFMAEVEGIPITQAVRRLRRQDSISNLENSIQQHLDHTEKKLKYFKWSSFCSTYPLVVHEAGAWEYLKKRGLSDTSILRFCVRWGGDTGKYRYRVIFPIRTVEGKLLSYVGRAIRDGMVPKTRKSRSPHRTLFGLYELMEKFGKRPLLVIVEGEIDAIYLQQYGIPAVANMGVIPMGPEKIRLLRRYTKRVVLSYDGDDAGEKAVHGDEKRCGELRSLSLHIPTVSVHLPEGRDPNNLSEKEVAAIYGNWKM